MGLDRSCREPEREYDVECAYAIRHLPARHDVKRNAVALEPRAGLTLDFAGQQDFFALHGRRTGLDPRREAPDLCLECVRAAERFSIKDERQHVVDESPRGWMLGIGRLPA